LQQQGTYRPVTTDTLEGDTVTILGYGSIGESVETRLSGFGINIQRVGRSSRTRSDGKQIHSFKELGGILPTTNVLVVLVPLTSETDGMIDRHLLAQLPTGSLVINAGRGKTVRTDDLIAELSTGRLRAVLDVTEPEPIPDGHPLWTTPNLLLTQHSSGDSSDYLDKVYPFINEQLRRYTSGEPLLNVVEGEY
jgi:phosphoglycerate dehydrogenase-like enzyme